jgi:hypothetical protein
VTHLRSRVALLSLGILAVLLLRHLLAGPAAPAAKQPKVTNLLTGATARLVGGVGDWVADGGSVSNITSHVLTMTSDGSDLMTVSSGRRTAARPGSVYQGTFGLRAKRVGRETAPLLTFFDATGNRLARVRGERSPDTADGWRPIAPVVAIAPPGAAVVTLGLVVAGGAPDEEHLLERPVLSQQEPTRRAVVGPLHTSGTQLRDARGPLVLQGIHRVALEGGMGSTTGQNLTAADLAEVKRWGGNVVRLSVSSAFWLRTDCHYDHDYRADVAAAVKAVTDQRMVALVDLHTNTLTGCGQVARQLMADSTALQFWKEVATAFRANPLVAFDLYNEPHDISDQVWLSGGPVRSADGTLFRAAGMQQMYDVVRAAGATNLVVVSGNTYGSRLPALRVHGVDVVYGVHAYTCPASTESGCAADRFEPGPILGSWVGADIPVMVTEFGWPSGESGRYVRNVIAFAREQAWGWIAFAWDGRADGRFTLLSTAGPGTTYEPSPAGMPVLAALAAR